MGKFTIMAFSACVGGVRFLCDVFGAFGKSMYVVESHQVSEGRTLLVRV